MILLLGVQLKYLCGHKNIVYGMSEEDCAFFGKMSSAQSVLRRHMTATQYLVGEHMSTQ